MFVITDLTILYHYSQGGYHENKEYVELPHV
jgi:hypothetical protein